MDLPRIGDTITTSRGLELCQHFKFENLVSRIKSNPGSYNNWKFDGCSGLPDELLGIFTGLDWKKITMCCLKHDLKYMYGRPGSYYERKKVDRELAEDLITEAEMRPWLAEVFYHAVQTGGCEELGLSFSWAGANKGL